MGATETVKKQVLAASGNECAEPSCQEMIFHLEHGVILGEIAHIKGEKPKSARYDLTQTNLERNSFDNLIALCPNHHTLIDKAVDSYPVDMLCKWKKDHECKIHNIPDKNRISPPNRIMLAKESEYEIDIRYWIDKNNIPQIYTDEQLVICNTLQQIMIQDHKINEIFSIIDNMNAESQINYLKQKVKDLNFNKYGYFGTFHELHLLAKDVTFLDYELYNIQGYRSQEEDLKNRSFELLEEKLENFKGNVGDLNDLHKSLKNLGIDKSTNE